MQCGVLPDVCKMIMALWLPSAYITPLYYGEQSVSWNPAVSRGQAGVTHLTSDEPKASGSIPGRVRSPFSKLGCRLVNSILVCSSAPFYNLGISNIMVDIFRANTVRHQ